MVSDCVLLVDQAICPFIVVLASQLLALIYHIQNEGLCNFLGVVPILVEPDFVIDFVLAVQCGILHIIDDQFKGIFIVLFYRDHSIQKRFGSITAKKLYIASFAI